MLGIPSANEEEEVFLGRFPDALELDDFALYLVDPAASPLATLVRLEPIELAERFLHRGEILLLQVVRLTQLGRAFFDALVDFPQF